jgi:hypothetical protein
MSANTMAASKGKRRIGCSVTSAAPPGSGRRPRSRVLGADRPVLGQVTPGLAHEPDWRPVEGLAGQGAKEEGLRRHAGLRDSSAQGFNPSLLFLLKRRLEK